ncbi:MAG TPA: DUF3592 domain-containing protein [Woeseiaceae bacterium]|nr:DUF3592 domain-containing protein [Woeseiaceae bacterium]
MAELVLTIIVLAVAGFFAVRWVKKRASAMAGLLTNGETVTGRIVMAKRVRRSRTYKACMVRYAFVTRDGREYEREIEVRPRDFESYTEGQEIDIVYDPGNPEKSMLQSAVRKARDTRHSISAPR